jgi:hypothetical protein
MFKGAVKVNPRARAFRIFVRDVRRHALERRHLHGFGPRQIVHRLLKAGGLRGIICDSHFAPFRSAPQK